MRRPHPPAVGTAWRTAALTLAVVAAAYVARVRPAADVAAPTVRVYDVSDLIAAAERTHDDLDPGWRTRPVLIETYAGTVDEPAVPYWNGQWRDGLVHLVRDCVRPDSWDYNGSTDGEVHFAGGCLIVRRTTAGHRAVSRFLDRLRRP